MARKARVATAAVAVLAAGLGTVAALAATGDAPADKVAVPQKQVYREGEWTIEVPDGWTKKEWTDRSDAEKAVRYEGPDGEYFIVAIDPLGSDYLGDAVWNYRVDGNRFDVVKKLPGAETVDDGRFDGMLIWKSGSEPVTVGGHTYYFMFGNAEKNAIDETVFDQIVESIRAN